MSLGIVCVGHLVAIFCAKLRKEESDRLVYNGVPHVIRGVVSESTQRECVFVQVVGFVNEIYDEVSATHVMREIAEELVPKGIVAHVLDQGSTVREGVRFPEILSAG